MLLRGGQEHRELRISQLKRLQNPDRYVYYKNASKNRPGGLMQSNLDHKVVSIVANPAVGDGCHISILDKYLMKLPPAAHEKDIFYCKPMPSIPTVESATWYYPVPVGKNTLS